jgi:hypothetical protein
VRERETTRQRESGREWEGREVGGERKSRLVRKLVRKREEKKRET